MPQSLMLPLSMCLGFGAMIELMRRRQREMRAVLDEVVDSIAGGFVMWDADDRLVTCNEAFRDTYPLCAEVLQRGTTFEAIIRHGVARGQYPQGAGRDDEFVREMVEAHQRGEQTAERLLPGGRWLLIHERRTRSGKIIGTRTDITAFKRALAEISEARNVAEHMAHHDALTGLPNRVLFHDRLAKASAFQREGGPAFAVLYLDLDRFKQINDRLGHGGGDELLAAFAGRLRTEVTSCELVARLSGDEFAVLLVGDDVATWAEETAARLVKALSGSYRLATGEARVGLSVGVAVCGTAEDGRDVLRRADEALYAAKRSGRGAFRFLNGVAPSMVERDGNKRAKPKQSNRGSSKVSASETMPCLPARYPSGV